MAGVQEGAEGVQLGIDREGAGIRGGASQLSPAAPRVSIESRRVSGEVEEAQRRARRYASQPRAFPGGKQLLVELSGLRSELQCVTTQVCRMNRLVSQMRGLPSLGLVLVDRPKC